MRPYVDFSKRSLSRLETVVTPLRWVILEVANVCPFDLTVLEGIRSAERQKELYSKGRYGNPGPIVTHIDGVTNHSMHQDNGHGKSRAIDIAPWPLDWDNKLAFHVMAGVIFSVCTSMYGTRENLRWGGDWNGNWDYRDQSFHDLPHFEWREGTGELPHSKRP